VTIYENLVEKRRLYINMGLTLILLVMVAFLAAIFTSGYNDKPGSNK
jgi:low affinity Fe/Cu permease